MSGRFITFEGPEGSGKSTQIRLLAEKLESLGIEVAMTREPGGTPVGESIRGILQHDAAGESPLPRAELMLFAASRAQLMGALILPALERGAWVLCDRFIDSTMAYQGFARGMDIDTLDRINDFAIGGRKPDLTVVLDLDVECGFLRLRQRYRDEDGAHDRFEREAIEFHQRVRDGYRRLAKREPGRIHLLDSDRPIEVVASEVWMLVKERFL